MEYINSESGELMEGRCKGDMKKGVWVKNALCDSCVVYTCQRSLRQTFRPWAFFCEQCASGICHPLYFKISFSIWLYLSRVHRKWGNPGHHTHRETYIKVPNLTCVERTWTKLTFSFIIFYLFLVWGGGGGGGGGGSYREVTPFD